MWACVLALALLAIKALGAPLGEPVADDFYFLRRVLLEHNLNLFDGGGFLMYWRPLSRQVYFALFGSLMLRWPVAIAILHLAMLGLAAWLIFSALRRTCSAECAAWAASFPFLMESARMMLSWPSHFQDVGLILFGALALHEAAAGRLGSTVAALLAALLCKEPAALLALLVPWTPTRRPVPKARRARWMLACGGLVALWGIGYWVIRQHLGGRLMPWDFGSDLEMSSQSFTHRYAWALRQSVQDALGISALSDPWRSVVSYSSLLLFAIAVIGLALRRELRARLKPARPWLLLGAAWFVVMPVMLVNTYPLWAPYRTVFGAVGAGIACAVWFGSIHRAPLWGLFVLRSVALIVSPGAPRAVSLAPEEHGSAYDFPKLARLQRFIRDTRYALMVPHPHLPRSSEVVPYYLPRMAEYAYAGNRALQVWYRDTTLSMIGMGEFRDNPTRPVAVIVEYERDSQRQVALVEPSAMRHLLTAIASMEKADWTGGLADLAQAESLQTSTDARAFHATVAGRRAACLLGLGDATNAEGEAQRALSIWRYNADSRRVLAAIYASRGLLAAAEAQLDTQLVRYPQDDRARMMRDQIRLMLQRGR